MGVALALGSSVKAVRKGRADRLKALVCLELSRMSVIRCYNLLDGCYSLLAYLYAI